MLESLYQTLVDNATSNPVQFAAVTLITAAVGAPAVRLATWGIAGPVKVVYRAVSKVRSDLAERRRMAEFDRSRDESFRRASLQDDVASAVRKAMGEPVMAVSAPLAPLGYSPSSGVITVGTAPHATANFAPAECRSGRQPRPGEARVGDQMRIISLDTRGASSPDKAGKMAEPGDYFVVAIDELQARDGGWGAGLIGFIAANGNRQCVPITSVVFA